jgi:hypothetical protein
MYFFVLVLFGTQGLYANVVDSKAQIVQKCLDIPEIQLVYPVDGSGNHIPVHIMQYPIVFDTDIALEKFGSKPVYMNRTEMRDNKIEAYFLFQEIDIKESSAHVAFVVYYNQSTTKQVMLIDLNFEKKENDWVIMAQQIKKL